VKARAAQEVQENELQTLILHKDIVVDPNFGHLRLIGLRGRELVRRHRPARRDHNPGEYAKVILHVAPSCCG